MRMFSIGMKKHNGRAAGGVIMRRILDTPAADY